MLFFFFSSAPEKSILMQMLAEMNKRWQIFSRGMFWLKLKNLYNLRSFVGNKGAGKDDLLESGATWKQLHAFLSPQTPMWVIRYSEEYMILLIDQPLPWVRLKAFQKEFC